MATLSYLQRDLIARSQLQQKERIELPTSTELPLLLLVKPLLMSLLLLLTTMLLLLLGKGSKKQQQYNLGAIARETGSAYEVHTLTKEEGLLCWFHPLAL